MRSSQYGLTTSGLEQSKGHTGQGSLGKSMLETVTLVMLMLINSNKS